MTDKLFEEIDDIFRPRSLAVVGVTDRVENQGMSFLLGHRKLEFKGPLYAIHPAKTFKRFETYPRITAVPGPVDHVKICVPAASVAEVMRDCVAKKVKCATVFSSGFRESGTEAGAALEEEVAAIAKAGGVRVIGPNCMGLYCPETGLSIRVDMPRADGNIALVSQSGGVAISLGLMGAERGLGFSKVVSYGNESDLGPPEFLHYLARDPKTSVICVYIEGTRRPRELRAALADAASRKPVIVLKGGSTAVGHRAVASHTGAMTGEAQSWKAMIRQTGAAMVDDIDEMLDLAMLLTLSRRPPGDKVGLFTVSGGFGVFATDQVVKAGFQMPELSKGAQKALSEYVDAPGTSIKNPLDLAAKFFQPQNYQFMFPALDSDPNIDSFVVICAIEYLTYLGKNESQWATFMVKSLIGGLKLLKKPVYVVFFRTALDKLRIDLESEFIKESFPVYPTMGRCLAAMDRAMKMKVPEK